MMPNDSDAFGLLSSARTVLKDEVRRLPARHELDCLSDMAIVVAGQGDHGTTLPEPGEQHPRSCGGGAVVHQVAYDDELAWLVIIEQLRQPIFD
jgi:hypothetical protein